MARRLLDVLSKRALQVSALIAFSFIGSRSVRSAAYTPKDVERTQTGDYVFVAKYYLKHKVGAKLLGLSHTELVLCNPRILPPQWVSWLDSQSISRGLEGNVHFMSVTHGKYTFDGKDLTLPADYKDSPILCNAVGYTVAGLREAKRDFASTRSLIGSATKESYMEVSYHGRATFHAGGNLVGAISKPCRQWDASDYDTSRFHQCNYFVSHTLKCWLHLSGRTPYALNSQSNFGIGDMMSKVSTRSSLGDCNCPSWVHEKRSKEDALRSAIAALDANPIVHRMVACTNLQQDSLTVTKILQSDPDFRHKAKVFETAMKDFAAPVSFGKHNKHLQQQATDMYSRINPAVCDQEAMKRKNRSSYDTSYHWGGTNIGDSDFWLWYNFQNYNAGHNDGMCSCGDSSRSSDANGDGQLNSADSGESSGKSGESSGESGNSESGNSESGTSDCNCN
eukprot:TRINITY_DN17476_c0_g4_i1.p1 TRINITY_DN17476_c0_g4~~TRINITY_DN17476_c0_g4_i1.p1  ORF type:complete len:466 (-),score=51.27 TRINITY_DN17476_c0_g4_i1:126-1475(-)